MATDFQGYSHQQLKAMIASLDPETAKTRAAQLKKAADDIAKIAEKLKNHRVKGWEGEAAVKFQEWVGRAGNATLRLSEYSAEGSKWMTDAVQKMVEASKMPAYDTVAAADLEAARKYHNDPDSQQISQTAHSKLNSDHAEAVKLMKALAESYEHSSTQMNKAEIPTFPPPPPAFVPEGYGGETDRDRSAGSSGSGSSGSSSYASSAPVRSGATNEPGWVPGHPPKPDNTVPTMPMPSLPVTPDHNVDVGLDTVTTLPNPTLPPTTTPGGPLPTGPGGPTPIGPVPPVPLPPVGGMKTIPGIGPVGLPPGGPVPGTSGPLGKLGMPGLPSPRDTGIMGGRPVTSTGPSAGIPRGTVIGTEGAQAGRGMMGGGMGHGAGGAHGGHGGSPVGRRLASEPGGIVGGRQPATGGRSTPFTQGGSGLVRNNAGGVGAGARTPGGRRDDHAGERPDYLAEDEETWQGNRRVVPPVID
ncbi:WXG100 family type VII secretion target [Streptomyces sp. NPDC048258]|uniref:WXG100 family type VII secretion target n=1 Tax=Streptomyces sp. NPDC048258 TaxID=3365527 RepID=UPI003714BB7B